MMLRKVSRTRFASHESVLEAFLRTRPVLVGIVASPEFEASLWECRTSAEKEERYNKYIKFVQSIAFYRHMREMHNIFYHIRGYLRHFDSDLLPYSRLSPPF